jgi:DNA polymerase
MGREQAAALLEELAAGIRRCTACRLSVGRTHAVPGEGSLTARIMFVGEGPGQQEDRLGRPFVGPAGELLNELLAEAGLRREDVYVTNIVKCRPTQNREPLPDEVAACRDYLNAQIALINPRVVCTLGRPALQTLVDPSASITREHGRPREVAGMLYVPLYHPAAALHRKDLRPALVEDMRRLRTFFEQEARQER